MIQAISYHSDIKWNILTQLYTLMYQTKYLILYYQLQGKIKPTYLRNRSVLK